MAFGAKIKLSVDTSGASAFRKEIQAYTDNSTAKTPIYLHNIKVTKAAKDNVLKDLRQYLNSNTDMVVKINSIDASGAITKLRGQLQTMLSGLSITGLKDFLGTGDVEATYNQAAVSAEKLATATESMQKASSGVNASLQKTNDTQSNISANSKTAVVAIKQVAAESEKSSLKEISNSHRAISLKSQIHRWILSNSRAYKTYGTQIDNILKQLDSEEVLTDKTGKKVAELRDGLRVIDTESRKAGLSGKTFIDTFVSGIEKFGGWSLVTRSLMGVWRGFKDMLAAVKEVDSAMTELRKVTDLTEATYAKFITTASTMAKSVGASLADAINSTADFARLGYTLEESASLAEAALVYKNVGDGIDDISEASESLISTIKAFGIEATDSMNIVDKFNEVGNNFAISSEGIGVALQKSASSLAAANNSIEESIALATAMNSVLQNPEVVGTALKTVSMYLRAAKTDAEEAGESTDGMANSISELREELLTLTNNKVDIMLDDKTFKSTYQIMKELAGVWEDLSDIDTANILELIGGKRNATAVTSLLRNFQDAESALQTANQASGSALAENEKYLDSIAGKMDILKANFETFSVNLINSDVVKFVVDIGSGLIFVLDALQRIGILIPTITFALVTLKGTQTARAIAESVAKVNTLSASLINEKAATNMLSTSVAALTVKEKQQLKVNIQNAIASGKLTEQEGKQILSTLALDAAETKLTATNKILGVSFKSAMASVPVWGWIALAITIVTEGVMKLTDKIGQNKQEAIDSANEIVNAYNSAQDSFDSNITTLNSMKEEFYKLSDGVDENGENVSLTADEYERYLSLISQIVNISPDICSGYDNEGRAIVNYKSALDDAIYSQETYLKNQRNIYLGKGEDIFDGKAKEWKEASKELLNASAADDFGDNSLDDAISGRDWKIFSDKSIKKLYAFKNALKELSIEWIEGSGALSNDPKFVMQLYENYEKIMVLLQNSGAYTDDELLKIENRFQGLAGAYTKLQSIEQDQINYLSEWAKDRSWYNEIPIGALDEFSAGLQAVNDPLKSYSENTQAAEKYGAEFRDTLASASAQKIAQMSTGLKDGSVSIEEYNSAVAGFKSSFDGSDAVLDSVLSYFNSLPKSVGFSTETTDKHSASLSDLSSTLTKLKSNYELVDTAQKEMATGGLSPETIKSLSDETANYIDYLYEENGAIKLNIDAWKKRANKTMDNSVQAIEDEIDSLQSEREIIQNNLDEWNNKDDRYRTKHEMIAKYSAELDANTAAIEANQAKLEIYNTLYENTAGAFDAYSSALQNFSYVSDTISLVSDALTTVADIQEAVANGFTLSLDKALEFAKVYPEILNGATVAANGQIALNSSVVNAFIEGKEAELRAQIDAEIIKLEADKATLTAKMEFSRAQLELAKSVGTGEGQISKEVAEYRVNAGNAVAEALIAAGIDEATAFQLACAAMAQNSEEFDRVAAEVCTDVQGNFNQAAFDAAQSIYTNMQNSKQSIASVAAQAHEAAKAIAGIASGTVQGSSNVQGGGTGGVYTGKGSINVTSGSFNGTEYTYTAKTVELEDFISDLELDITSYQNAISQIDGQIAALRALRNTNLSSLSTNSKKGNSGKSKGSQSSSKEESWFEKQYKYHDHLLNMDAESVQDYLNWLNSAYKQAYNEGIIDLNEFYKYQEEVYKKLQDLFKDYLNDVEHEISMRENFDGENKKIISLYKQLITDVEKEIRSARAQGLKDTDDYIQDLQDKWASYKDAIKDIEDEVNENAKDALNDLIDYQKDMFKQDIENQKDALDDKLDYLKEFYDKQKEMLQDQYDEEEYLKEQSEKRKSVTDIQAQLAQLEFDDSAWAQKRKVELQEELSTAQEELDDFEKQHALDLALDALENAYDEQEAQLQKQMDALDEELNNPELMFNKALTAIQNSTEGLYQAMLEYNRKYGTGNDDDVKDIYEAAYKALLEYRELYGKDYEGVTLSNETGYQGNTGWDSAPVSGTNSSNAPSNPTTSNTSSASTAPSLEKGSSITVKQSATNFSAKSKYARMKSFVPGGTYTVYKTSGDEVLIGRNGVYTGWINKWDIVGYATGTRNATAGLHSIDELGTETIFESADGTRYKMFSGGEKVLNAKASNFLYDFANSGGSILEKILQSLSGSSLFDKISPSVVNNEIRMGDIIVQGNAEKQTVSEIRREQRSAVEMMLKKFNQLNR